MKPKLSQKVGRAFQKASPTILTCIGAVGVVATAVLAVKATPKALEMVRADSRKNHDGNPHAATKVEVVKSCWKCYIPAAVTGAATIACSQYAEPTAAGLPRQCVCSGESLLYGVQKQGKRALWTGNA